MEDVKFSKLGSVELQR